MIKPTFDSPFNDEDLRNIWSEWEQHRKEKKQKLTPMSVKKQLKFLHGRSSKEIIEIIEQSIRNGWTGLFELKNTSQYVRTATKGETRSTDAIIEPVKDFGIKQGFSRNNINGRGS